jgi:TonB family protein
MEIRNRSALLLVPAVATCFAAVATAQTADVTASTSDYPIASLRNAESGVVEVVFAVDASGHASRCAVVASSGFARLDRQACQTITARSDYPPTIVAGAPVTSMRKVKLRFAIDAAPAARTAPDNSPPH